MFVKGVLKLEGEKNVNAGKLDSKLIRPFPRYDAESTTSGKDADAIPTNPIEQFRGGIGELEAVNEPTIKRGAGATRIESRPITSHRRDNSDSQFVDSGVRNATSHYSGNEEQGNRSTNRSTEFGTNSETNVRGMVQEGITSESIPLLPLETKTIMDLPAEVDITFTKMLEKELEQFLTQPVTESTINVISNSDPIEQPVTVFNTPVFANTKTAPAKQSSSISNFKFDKQTNEELTEIILWVYDGIDAGLFYGSGIDTKTLPIWRINESQAKMRVRILEKRAAKNQVVREVVIPKLLEFKDYIGLAIEDIPKLITTAYELLQNGIHPQFGKKEGDKQNAQS